MSVALAAEPRLLHAIPGRMRVHLPGWLGHDQRSLETRLRKVEGIKGVLANPVTGNVLIRFDPAVTDPSKLLAVIPSVGRNVGSTEHEQSPPPTHGTKPPHALYSRHGHHGRARITVRGLSR